MDQQFIEIAVPLQGGDAPVGGGIGQPGAGIGLVLHRMAKAAQVATALAPFQARHQVGGAQIGPADHRLHPGRAGGEVEQRLGVDADLPVELFRSWAKFVFDNGFNRLPQPMKLSLMAGIEHFTAVLAEYMMNHEEIFFQSHDEKQRAIWMWHMLEESEHKDIAYDVFQSLSNNYALRIAGFFPALITILLLISFASLLVPFYRRPKNLIRLSYWKEMPYSIALIFGLKDGVYGSTMRHIFDYLRPNFHPNDHDTSAYLSYYKEKLLDPEHGILTPYFTREFIPSLRS